MSQTAFRRFLQKPRNLLFGGLLLSTVLAGSIALFSFLQRPYSVLGTHTGPVTSVTFSLDGSRLASGGCLIEDCAKFGEIFFWHPGTQVQLGQTETDATGIADLAYSPDGRVFASLNQHGTLKLWEVHEEENPRILVYTSATIAFKPDTGELAFFSATPEYLHYQSYNALTLEGRIAEIPYDLKRQSPPLLRFHPDGQIAAFTPAGTVAVFWDMEQQTKVGQPLVGHRAPINAMTFNPTGTLLATGSTDGMLIIWDVATQEIVHQLQNAPTAGILDIEFHPSGMLLAVTGTDDVIRLWIVDSGLLYTTLQVNHPYARPQRIPNNNTFANPFEQLSFQYTEFWRSASAFLQPPPEYFFADSSFSPDGTLLAAGSTDGRVYLWDLEELLPEEYFKE